MTEPRAVILVPRRNDNGPRDELWRWCKEWWQAKQSHMPIIEGHHDGGLFNRSAAVNLAARLAGQWDVAVIIDSDVICDPARVKEAVAIAHETGSMVLPHDIRMDLSPHGTRKVMAWHDGPWTPFVHMKYREMVSSVVVISRRQWDLIGGFDEAFRGWGYQDTAFAAAAETFGGITRMPGEIWHLWHPTAKEGKVGTDVWMRNQARGERYRAAIGDPDAIRALQAEGKADMGVVYDERPQGIPKIIHRVVPEKTSREVETWWKQFRRMHPGWELVTHRDPLEPDDWPMTSPHWHKAANGAQLADLLRLEALIRHGGIYVDSDVEPLRPLDPLLPLGAFAAWEDERCVPNAVMGAVPGHPAMVECLRRMVEMLPCDTWPAGPGITTAVLPRRTDVLVLPPGSFYPYHYREKGRRREDFKRTQPWAFVVHHWAGSWLEQDPEAARVALAAQVA